MSQIIPYSLYSALLLTRAHNALLKRHDQSSVEEATRSAAGAIWLHNNTYQKWLQTDYLVLELVLTIWAIHILFSHWCLIDMNVLALLNICVYLTRQVKSVFTMTAKPSPNPDDAGPIVSGPMGLPSTMKAIWICFVWDMVEYQYLWWRWSIQWWQRMQPSMGF